MASTVVTEDALGGAEIGDWLQQLHDDGLLLSIFGRYFLTDQARKKYIIEDPIKRALAHGRAAAACAPYISPNRLPGLIEFEASLPEMVHEAEYHLEQANRRPKQLGYYEDNWNKYSRGNILRQHPQARLSCSYEMKTWDVPRYAVAVHDFPLVADAMRIAVDLATERRQKNEKLRGFELSSTLGLIDRYLEELARGAMPADSDELRELTTLASALAPATYKAFSALKASEHTAKEAALLGARLAAIAMLGRQRKRELSARQKEITESAQSTSPNNTPAKVEKPPKLSMRLLWWPQINKMNNGSPTRALSRVQALFAPGWRPRTRSSSLA